MTTNNVATSAVVLTVMDAAPKIVTQPISQAVTVGTPVTFTAAASAPGTSVKWQIKTVGGSFKDITPAATSPTYVFTPTSQTQSGTQFRAVFTNTIGTTTTTAATLTVGVAPFITTDLLPNQPVTAGQSVSITAAASGTPKPTVQWQISTDGFTFTPIKGAASSTYTFTPTAAMDGASSARSSPMHRIGPHHERRIDGELCPRHHHAAGQPDRPFDPRTRRR